MRGLHPTDTPLGQTLENRLPSGSTAAGVAAGALMALLVLTAGVPIGFLAALLVVAAWFAAHYGYLGERMQAEVKFAPVVVVAGGIVVLQLMQPMDGGATVV